MNLKILARKTGMTQIEMAKKIGVTPAALNMQINMHRLLPEKHLDKFCKIMCLKKEDVIMAMDEANNE